MAVWAPERRFLVAFAEAVLGLPPESRPLAVKAVERLDTFLDSAPAGLRVNFHLAMLTMPPGLWAKWRFSHRSLTWRREFLDRLFQKYAYSPPGLLLDRQAILATVKSMVSGAYAELPEFWREIDYSPTPKALPTRANGQVVVPPSGPELRPSRSAIGEFLHEHAASGASLPERFPEPRTVVIIGSGAGGLAAAHALGLRPDLRDARIVILEAGQLVTNEGFPERTLDGLSQLYANAGSTPGANQRIGFIQGRCVGGGTTVNNGGSPRPTDEWGTIMQERWTAAGAAVDWNSLSTAFDDLAGPLHITPVEDHVITTGTQRAYDGFATLGEQYTRKGRLNANLTDCIGCGQCNNGCRYDAHTTPLLTLLPELLRRNSRVSLVPGVTVRKLVFASRGSGRTVSHLELETPEGARRLYADVVILAAGAVASTGLLLDSGFISAGGRHRVVGQRFSCNYASPVMGHFEERMDAGRGIQIGYIVEIPHRRLIIETAFAPPTIFGMMLPHWGSQFAQRVRAYNHMAVAFPTVSSDSYGTIDRSGMPMMASPWIRFALAPSDWARLGFGLRLCGMALARAGAREIFDSRYTGETIRVSSDLDATQRSIDRYFDDLGPQTFVRIQSAHLQGGNVMHRDPARGVVDSDLKVHGVDNLWILDSSVFPAPITLNIQYTTMALARYAALRLPVVPSPVH